MSGSITQNQVLGRGKTYFERFNAGTFAGNGYLYLGNTPSFTTNVAEEVLEHFDADSALRIKDRVATISQSMGGSFQTDNVSVENLALFFAGSVTNVTQSSLTSQSETFNGVRQGRFYRLGETASRRGGHRNVTVTGITVSATPAVLNTDYTVDGPSGMIYVVPGSTVITDNSNMVVTFNVAATTQRVITDLQQSIFGKLMFVPDNAVGANDFYSWPYVKLTADGDLSLKGQEWMTMNFNFESLKLDSLAPRQEIRRVIG